MNSDHRALLEYVSNVVAEQLHNLDPVRVRARRRLEAMLRRCAQVKEPDLHGTCLAKEDTMTTSAFRKHLSQFHGCGQGGFTDRKEDLADEIQGYVRKHFPSQELKTLERLSLRDLTVLRLALNRPGIGT